jgi:hypothetical protein
MRELLPPIKIIAEAESVCIRSAIIRKNGRGGETENRREKEAVV